MALIEGPAGIGKSRLLQLARRRGEAARRADPARRAPRSSSASSPTASCASSSRPSWPTPAGARAGARRRRRGRAAGVRVARAGPERRRPPTRRSPSLHGLFWLMLNLAADRPLVLAIDDLHWCDRPSLRFLAYLTRRLEGLPVLLAVTAAHDGAGHRPGAARARSPTTSRPPRAARAAHRRRRRRRSSAPRSAPRAAPTPSRPPCTAPPAATRCCVRQLLRALEAEGVQPDAASAGLVREIGPSAVARTVLVRLARQSAEGWPSRAPSRCSARAPSLARRRRARRGRRGGGRRGRRRAGARRDPARRAAARLRPRARARRRLPRDAARRARAVAHARASPRCARSARSPNQIAAQLLSVPPRGDGRGRRAAARRRPRRVRPRRARQRRSACSSGRSRSRRRRERRAAILLDLGLAETLVDGRAAAEHLRAAYDGLTDPVARARTAVMLTQVLTFTTAPDQAHAVGRQAIAELTPELLDIRRRLEAQLVVAVQWGAGLLGELDELVRHRAGLDEPGAGARMLEAMTALHLVYNAEPAEDCVALIERASADGALLEEDEGLFTVVVLMVLTMADRAGGLRLRRADGQARAPARLAVRDARRLALARLDAPVPRRAGRRGRLAADRADELDAWHGAAGGDVYAAAHYAQTQFERGDLEGARRTLDAALREQMWASLEASRWWNGGRVRGAARERPRRGGAGAERAHADRATRTSRTRRRSRGARRRRARCTGSGAPRRRSRSPPTTSRSRAASAPPRPWAARCASSASCRARPACRRSRSPSRCSRARPRGSSSQVARRPRPGAAPRAPAVGRARAAAARAGAGRRLRRRRAGRGGAHGALRRRRAAADRRAERRRRADRERAAGRRARRRGREQPRHRADAVRDPEDGRGPPLERLPQAGDPLAPRARRRARRLGGLATPRGRPRSARRPRRASRDR